MTACDCAACDCSQYATDGDGMCEDCADGLHEEDR